MKKAKTEDEQKQILEKWRKLNNGQEDTWLNAQGVGSYWDLNLGKGMVIKEPLCSTWQYI